MVCSNISKFKFGGGTSQRITSSRTLCTCVSGSVAVLSLDNKAMSLQIHKKHNWNRVGAPCFTIHVEERQASKEHHCIRCIITCCGRKYYWGILIRRFQPQLPNLIPHQIFQLYDIKTIVYCIKKKKTQKNNCLPLDYPPLLPQYPTHCQNSLHSPPALPHDHPSLHPLSVPLE